MEVKEIIKILKEELDEDIEVNGRDIVIWNIAEKYFTFTK